jgi:hypothetical protein
MRLSWLALLPIGFGFVTCAQKKAAQPFCTPGDEIFCKCRGGAAGTKLCGPDGAGFITECRQADGTCTEVPNEVTDDAAATVGSGTMMSTTSGMSGAGGSAGSCKHDICALGGPLDPNCHPCVKKICAAGVDPFCCDLDPNEKGKGNWDEYCLEDVAKYCGMQCGGTVTTTSSGMGGAGATSSSTGSMMSSSSSSGSGGGGSCYTASELITGDLVITEIMNNPGPPLKDEEGEWFEVYNSSSVMPKCIDLKGVIIASANDSDHTIASSVIVPLKGYVVIGRIGSKLSSIGVNAAYTYGSAINLSNTSDSIALKKSASYTIDQTSYSAAYSEGVSRSLSPSKLSYSLNDVDSSFCPAKSFIQGSSGDRGTPGKANDSCP